MAADWLAAAGNDPGARAFGELQMAWGHRYRNELAPAEQCLARALALYQSLDDEAGLANCRDLAATLWSAQRRHGDALRLLDANAAIAPSRRPPIERLITHDRRGFLHDMLGDRDESLRERYAALDAARESGDPAAIGFTLGMLGGVQADLYNLEDADQLCSEGERLADSVGAFQAWSLAALNHMNALVTLEQGERAVTLARRLLAIEAQLPPRAAEQRLIVYADAFLLTGELEQAQALLDRSRALRTEGSQSLISHTCAQLRAWQATGELERARALGEAYLADPDNGTDPAQVPSETLRILRSLAEVCEALGDPLAALRHQKEAYRVHETLVGRSARARRLTLEIQHRLDRERWSREEAQRRQRDAEAEGERLAGLNRELSAANLAKSRFLAAASHDLRQPLQAMSLYLAALQSRPRAPATERREILGRMDQAMGTLTGLFDALMDLSRFDAGAVEPEHRPVRLSDWLPTLVQPLELRAQSLGGSLRLRLPRRAGSALGHSDPILLGRLLGNLIDNALKYAPGGPILVALRRREGGSWRIEVRDAGPGIAPEQQARIFDEFYRLDRPSGDEPGGLGLGLSIVQRLSGLLGHPIGVRSRPGHGATFWVELPPGRADPDAVEPARASVPTTTARPLSLAVIDDDEAVRDALTRLLRGWGHTVHAAGDARSLLGSPGHAGPSLDAIIADYQLGPAGTGLAAIAALRRDRDSPIPALIVTGDAAPGDLRDLQASGLPWLAKPVRALRLRSWLAGITRDPAHPDRATNDATC